MPKFDHDCDSCVFLEHWEGMDWYYCPRSDGCFGGTILGRCSDEPSDYCSNALGILLRPESAKFHKDNPGTPLYRSGYMVPAYERNKEKIEELKRSATC